MNVAGINLRWFSIRNYASSSVYLCVACYFMNDKFHNFKVTDRQSFSEFINLLRQELIDNPESWENNSLPNFLEALSRYANDIKSYYDNMKQDVNADQPNWQTFADILRGATIYE